MMKVQKDLASRVFHVTLGQKVERDTFGGIWMANLPNGLPRRLPLLSKLVESNPLGANTLVAFSRMLRSKPSKDISTITSAKTSDLGITYWEDFKTFVKRNLHPISVKPSTTYHTSVKAGPNGPAAILSSAIDAWELSRHGLLPLVCHLLVEAGVPEVAWRLVFLIREMRDHVDLWTPQSKECVAKLSFLADKAGKTRVVYILNWWVQEALLPLHNAMMAWLREQPTDGTFDQLKAVRLVQQWTKEGKPLWSFDLTAATDRWPMFHQWIVVRALSGNVQAHLWWRALTCFLPKVGHEVVAYRVGQPMGAYASWAALAVTHHLLIRYLAHREGCPCEYVVLGDDVVIANSTLAQAYKQALTDLGVTISRPKSVTPEKSVVTDSSAEFAKRLLRGGKDLTPIPVELMYEIFILHQWWKITDLIQELSRRMDCDILVHNGSIFVSDPVHEVLRLLPEKERLHALSLFGNVWSVTLPYREVRDEDPSPGTGYHSYPNPWEGVETLTFLHYWGEVVAERLLEDANKLNSLKASLAGDRGYKRGRPDFELKSHPIWAVIDRLDKALWSCYTTITRGEQDPDAVNLMADAEALEAVLTKGKGYRDWLRSKDRKQKLTQTLTVKVLRRCK
jgi:hypothetical protein